jgi:hypothetical protein
LTGPRRGIAAVLAAIALATAAWMGARSHGAAGRASTAEARGIFPATFSSDLRAQAVDALAADARLREDRFLEAVQPGRAFGWTRAGQADILAGRWPIADVYEMGAQLFHLSFTRQVGYGARDLPPIVRFQRGRRGGPDAQRCDSCHWRGGSAGAGDAADDAYLQGDGDSQSSALARNPIALPGAGILEIVARQMTAELQRERGALLAAARASGVTSSADLQTNGVSFGRVVARPDGTLDLRAVAGVDPDLVIKPFGWKGNMATVREAVEDALLVHHGMESDYLVRSAPPERIGPFDPRDPDGDGVAPEIEEGQVTALTLFVAMQEVPSVEMPSEPNMVPLLGAGRTQLTTLGCASCHVPSIPFDDSVFRLPSRMGGGEVTVDLREAGAEPRLERDAQTGRYRAFLYSDLKRHDLGAALAEPRDDRGVAGAMFLTPPLWGVARSRPYLHDGRAATLEDAILAHGGEAQEARDAYAHLPDSDRAPLRVFLTSLSRARRLAVR